MDDLLVDYVIKNAIYEDLAFGDITTDNSISGNKLSKAFIILRNDSLISGIDIAKRVFSFIDDSLFVKPYISDGDFCKSNSKILYVEGKARSILKAERTAINFMARMSGIADITAKFVNKLSGFKTKLLDTRKTTPGLRLIEKLASKHGGALNHRFNLSSAVLVKENHIKAAGSICSVIKKLKNNIPPSIRIELETSNLNEVKQALDLGIDFIMLDNFSIEDIKKALKLIKNKAIVEISGNVNLKNIEEIAKLNVDFISTSAMFHSSKWADYSLLFE